MYTFIALGTLALAVVSQAASSHVGSALENFDVEKRGLQSIKLDGDLVRLKPRDGGDLITLRDPELYNELKTASLKTRARVAPAKRAGFSRITDIFRRQGSALCGDLCGDSPDATCSGSTSTSFCSCLKDCGPEGEECFSTCFTIQK